MKRREHCGDNIFNVSHKGINASESYRLETEESQCNYIS